MNRYDNRLHDAGFCVRSSFLDRETRGTACGSHPHEAIILTAV